MVDANCALALALCAVATTWYASAPPRRPPAAHETGGERVFTPGELASFDGTQGRPIYLAILGTVYDVSSGAQHYARGKSYAHMAGRDATRSFGVGQAGGAGLTDDTAGLSDAELQGVWEWHGFFATHTEGYVRLGRVAGRWFDAAGRPLAEFPSKRLARAAEDEAARRQRLPECNSRWSQAEGSEVWCTKLSGGVARGWAGVPRLYDASLDPATTGPAKLATGTERCACVQEMLALTRAGGGAAHLRVYHGCDPAAERCKVDARTE